MHGSHLHSCANCWFNGLQSGSVGLSLGYCTEHGVVLRQPDETTCGRQVRLDLPLASARVERTHHRRRYAVTDAVVRLVDGEAVVNGAYVAEDTSALRTDPVGAAVADYREYGTTIESLAQLRAQATCRAEFAMLSLGRAYVDRCVSRGGRWTSGLHLLWWTRQRLADDPQPVLAAADLRYQTAANLDRQLDLCRWWLLMLRLVFISDVATHAVTGNGTGPSPDGLAELCDLAEQAAAETEIPTLRKLSAWVRRTGLPTIDRCLPESRYRELAAQLHRD